MNINPDNLLPPRKGRLLVSKPFLDDPYFKRTVILLCDHNEEGSFGFVLNKYVDLDLSDIKLNIPGVGDKLAIGGPVENKNVYYLHQYGNEMPDSIHVIDDLYMGGSFEDLKVLMASPEFNPNKVRFFIGYSGWTVDQLLEELKPGQHNGLHNALAADLPSSPASRASPAGAWRAGIAAAPACPFRTVL